MMSRDHITVVVYKLIFLIAELRAAVREAGRRIGGQLIRHLTSIVSDPTALGVIESSICGRLIHRSGKSAQNRG